MGGLRYQSLSTSKRNSLLLLHISSSLAVQENQMNDLVRVAMPRPSIRELILIHSTFVSAYTRVCQDPSLDIFTNCH
jgi:hypothetical protein